MSMNPAGGGPKITISYLDSARGGFAEGFEVDEGLTAYDAVKEQRNGSVANIITLVNGEEISKEYILQDGDVISVTPTKVAGASMSPVGRGSSMTRSASGMSQSHGNVTMASKASVLVNGGDLFLVAALLHPTQAESEGGKPAEVVLNPEWIQARNAQSAEREAIRKLKKDVDLDRVEVKVRPF